MEGEGGREEMKEGDRREGKKCSNRRPNGGESDGGGQSGVDIGWTQGWGGLYRDRMRVKMALHSQKLTLTLGKKTL